ncbi:AAA family ATPase [Chromohalobacter israelensis]|uniref:AAA family ATPase n=1 Tax=Chromohalobacter israelensis TaxID=141390 RepID=UPI0005551EAB|nr:AAA family ATPase [Chromohalobacter israelensis]MDF9434626.1 AAA family ATPase [Chromohalobacter israelensis]
MATARQDFERFVGWLYQEDKQVPADVRRLAHLALENFDMLAGTSRQRSQRASYLVELIRENLAQTADTPPQIQPDGVVDAWPWARLSHLTLGPFRGFLHPEPFDLQNQVVLFYGPNGSGKTSLCEGLEYALLGEVEEAGAKRIAARTYLSNVHAQCYEPPILKATSHQGQEIDVVANADMYRFCFIEKNRIDAFSRIAARPNNQRAELIATLFGMDQFNDFVSHFNESIDGQLVLSPAKQTELADLRAALETDKAIVDGEPDTRHRLRDEEAALAMSYAEGTDYAGLKELIGSAEAPGRLQELNKLLDAVPPSIIGVKRQTMLDAFEKAHQCQQDLNEITSELQSQSNQVSFKALYDAVLALQQTVGERCPACDTPLQGTVHVVANPYEKATTGLSDLRSLSELQQRQYNAQQALTQASRELREMMTRLENFIDQQQEQPCEAKQYLSGLSADPEGIWWATLYPLSEGDNAKADLLEQLLGIADSIDAQDTMSQHMQQERAPLVAERQRLLDFQLKVQAQDQKDKELADAIDKAKARIAAFDTDHAELISLAKQEEQDIIRDTGFKETYDRFLKELKSYREQLPGQFLAGLNEMALMLYNEFNQNDLDADKLASLHLPLTSEDKIEIAFRGNPTQMVNALHVLSEGHIRCLGLAILMAKAKSIGSPLIVFDDAINAIDHDHRRGIRETIFESEHFDRTQIIVTCHSNEFIKDIQQHLPRPRREDCQVYLFKHHTGDNQPRVVNNVATRNYIAKARAARETLNDREALGASRQALEMLSNKVWQWLVHHELGLLTVPLARAGAEPDLRNLCEALLKKLRKAHTFDHANKDPLIEAYGRIIAISESNLIWTYLNKGTHEEADRDDFDSDDVESVVQTLEQIDCLDFRRPR